MEHRIRLDISNTVAASGAASSGVLLEVLPEASISKSPYYFDKGLRKVHPYK